MKINFINVIESLFNFLHSNNWAWCRIKVDNFYDRY